MLNGSANEYQLLQLLYIKMDEVRFSETSVPIYTPPLDTSQNTATLFGKWAIYPR